MEKEIHRRGAETQRGRVYLDTVYCDTGVSPVLEPNCFQLIRLPFSVRVLDRQHGRDARVTGKPIKNKTISRRLRDSAVNLFFRRHPL